MFKQSVWFTRQSDELQFKRYKTMLNSFLVGLMDLALFIYAIVPGNDAIKYGKTFANN